MATTKAGISRLQGQLEAKLAQLCEENRVPGVAVGIYQDGEEQYAYHGVTSIENPVPVDATTLFQIGSTSKTFTATALMRLAEQGLVDLDAPVRKYVPELVLQDEDTAARVTVLQLLNHSAGWRGDFFDDTGQGDDALAVYVEKMADIEQTFPLGTQASYNNAAVNLAGRVIEKVTGKTYEAAVKELVLEPLGLDDSYFFMADVITRRFAVGHRVKDTDPEAKPTVARPWNLPRSAHPAGGLVSTAADQVKYARFHLGDGRSSKAEGEQVLKTETLKRMKQATFPLGGGALGDQVGISWLMKDVEGVRFVGHGGTTNGQLSAFTLVPERDFAITVLTNCTSGGKLHHDLVNWAVETYLGIVETDPEALALGEAELTDYLGDYDAGQGTATIYFEDGGLKVKVKYSPEAIEKLKAVLGDDGEPPEQPPIPIAITDPEHYVVPEGPAKGMKGNFVRDADGRVIGINFGGRLAPKK